MPRPAAGDREARIKRLQDQRAHDSQTKRTRALDACDALLRAGIEVTHTRVAKEARVSTWLTYNANEIRTAIDAAQAKQRLDGFTPAQHATRQPATSMSLRTDLSLAREHNRQLREEIRQLKTALHHHLGATVEGANTMEMVNQVRELEKKNIELNRAVAEGAATIARLQALNANLEADIEAKAEALRAMMFAQNT